MIGCKVTSKSFSGIWRMWANWRFARTQESEASQRRRAGPGDDLGRATPAIALAFMLRPPRGGWGGLARGAGARRGEGEEDVVESRFAAAHVVGVDAALLERPHDLDQAR